MSKSQHTPIPAVAYYRRSTVGQEHSIEDQRSAVEQYADVNGYIIIREYIDDGISGDKTEKREGFQRMHRDAARGDFKFILCWDSSRYGRFSRKLEAAIWLGKLYENGVTSTCAVFRKSLSEG